MPRVRIKIDTSKLKTKIKEIVNAAQLIDNTWQDAAVETTELISSLALALGELGVIIDRESRGYFVIVVAENGPACPCCERTRLDSVTEYSDGGSYGPTYFS